MDAWGNGGSDSCYAEDLAARFVTAPFQTVGYSLRASRDWISSFESRLSLAPASVREQAQANLNKVVDAYARDRGLTEPVPLCGYALSRAPAPVA